MYFYINAQIIGPLELDSLTKNFFVTSKWVSHRLTVK